MGLTRSPRQAPTKIVELKNGAIRAFEVTPEDAGLARAEPAALKGGEPRHNAEALTAVLDGADGAPIATSPLINAGAALVVPGTAASPEKASALGEAAIRSGAARRTLDRLIAVSNA